MHKKIALVIILIILSLLLSGGIVLAESLDDLQNKRDELENQITETNKELEGIEIELTDNLEQLNNLNAQISQYENDISTYEESLNNIQTDIETVSQRLDIVEESYNTQLQVLQNRLVALYEAGDIVYLDVLLNSNSVSEFISNYYLIGEVIRYDNEILESIESQKTRIASMKETLETRQSELKEIKNNKEKITIALENSKVIRNSYINKLTEDEKKVQEKIDECQKQLNNLETQIVYLTTLNLGEGYINGEFIWPAPGYTTITSRFGMRNHPILKVNRIHTGTDIAMPTGSYVIASNDGVVTQATYNVGYGNMVLIDHGGGISTLYGHGSEILVKVGQTVTKGDIIMKSGSTGWSTGPHLHFEVRIKGTAIDSLEFLQNQSLYTKEEDTNDEEINEQKGEEVDQINGGDSE